MELILNNTEKEEYFFNALCNGLSSLQHDFDIELIFDDEDYVEAKKNLQDMGLYPCLEDVLMQILREGNMLGFVDHNESSTKVINVKLKDIHDRVNNTPTNHLIDMFQENDDATTATVILQQVIFNEQIYG